MSAQKRFVWKGQEYMVVEPYNNMLGSGLVRRVVGSGRLFGVNLEEGKFGIIPDDVVKKLGLKENWVVVQTIAPNGNTYSGTMNEKGEVRFYIQGEWKTFSSLYHFLSGFNCE